MEKYVRVKKIGEGSFGKAVLMKRKDNGKMCVIKEIGISRMSPKEKEASKKEVKVLSQLTHPNIVAYQESFEGKGNLYIVMDYCEKGDLHQYITNRRSVHIEESKVLDIFTQCCLAIKYVHDRKILHRDIKTQNIFLTKDNAVKLGDFGIARVLKNTMELAHTCIGTPYYLSPEIVENRPYNNKSDIWSLGCVLYEMATLKHAFEAGNMKNLVMKIVRGSYPPIHSKYSYELRALVAQTFKRSPSDRPSINSILKKPFIQKIASKFEPSSQVEGEVLLKPKPSNPVVRPPVSIVEPSAKKNMAMKRSIEIASAYGVCLPKKAVPNKKASANPITKPKKVARNPKLSNENSNEVAARERRRRNFVAVDQRYQQKINKVQQDRWEKQNLAQMKIAREAGWRNVLGLTDEENKEKKVNLSEKDNQKKYQVKHDPPSRNASEDEKPVFPIKKNANIPKESIEQKPEQCIKPMNAWEVPPKAEVNIVQGNLNCDRAKLLEDYWQRKKQAEANRNRAHQDMYGNVNWKPPMANNKVQAALKNKVPSVYPAARNKQEQDYLQQLEAIRRQNFIERRAVNQKQVVDPNIKGDPRYDPEARKQKIEELKKHGQQKGVLLHQQKIPPKQVIRKSEVAKLPKKKNLVGNDNCKIILAKNVIGQQNNVWKEQQNNVWDDPQKAVWNDQKNDGNIQKKEIKKHEIIVPPVGIATAMREVNRQKLSKSCSEGDIQEAFKQAADQPLRRVWGVANCSPVELGMLPMEITSSAMEATSENGGENEDTSHKNAESSEVCKPLEHDRKTQLLENVVNNETVNVNKNDDKMRKFWVHDGKTQFVANLGMKNISGTQMPTYTIDRDSTSDNYFKHVPSIEPFMNNTITISQESNKCEGTYKLGESKPNTVIELQVDSETLCNSTETMSKNSSNVETANKDISKQVDATNSNTVSTCGESHSLRDVNTKNGSESPKMDSFVSTVQEHSTSIGTSHLDSDKGESKECVENSNITAISSISQEDNSKSESFVHVDNLRSTDVLIKEVDEVHPLQDIVADVVCERLESLEVDVPEEKLFVTAPVDAWTVTSHMKTNEMAEEDFHTPSRAFGLQTGFYDAETKLLRTCSLPDLTSLVVVPESTDAMIEASDVIVTDEFDEHNSIKAEDIDINKDVINDVDENSDVHNAIEILEINDIDEKSDVHNAIEILEIEDEKYDGLEEIANDIEIIDDDGVDEEEIDDYASMLESMSDLLTSMDSTNDSDHDTIEEDSVEWESDDDEGKEKTISTNKAKEKDLKLKEDLFSRIEESRKRLEDELGLERFMKVYTHLQMIQEHEDDELEMGTAELSKLLGDKEHLYQKILYLVMADSAYCEGNDGME